MTDIVDPQWIHSEHFRAVCVVVRNKTICPLSQIQIQIQIQIANCKEHCGNSGECSGQASLSPATHPRHKTLPYCVHWPEYIWKHTVENAKQMQQVEATFENKYTKLIPDPRHCPIAWPAVWVHFEDTHSGKKPNKCTQWKKPNNTFETNTRGRFRLYTLTPVWHCLALLPFPLLQCHYCFNYDYIFTQVGILNVQMFEKSIRSVFLPNVEKKSTVIAQVLPHANLFIHFKLTQVCLCLWLRNNTLRSCWLHDCTHEFASFNADFQKRCLGTRVRFNMLKLVGDLQW